MMEVFLSLSARLGCSNGQSIWRLGCENASRECKKKQLSTNKTSPGLTNLACMKLDRRLSGLALKFGWRYTRYADDITFSTTQYKPKDIKSIKKYITAIVEDEGFEIHPDKTTVMGRGNRQEVTGLIVNESGMPRTPREMRRMLRAAINNLKKGTPFKEGESLQTLIGYASFIYSTDKVEGKKYLNELANLPEGVGTEAYRIQNQ